MDIDDQQRVTDILKNLMADEAAIELQKDVDFDVVCMIFQECGYILVETEYGPERRWHDVITWVDSNHTGNFQEHRGKWLFESEEDAIMFKLRWGA